jgi:hypothetical protein
VACGVPGEQPRPNSCVDLTATPLVDGSLCADVAPLGDHEGECPEAPITQSCSVASGHPQRSCVSDADCCDDEDCIIDPVSPGDCEERSRSCYLDNGVVGQGIAVAGAEDVPSGGMASPTIAGLYCAPPDGGSFLHIVAGLPGPARFKLRETMRLVP